MRRHNVLQFFFSVCFNFTTYRMKFFFKHLLSDNIYIISFRYLHENLIINHRKTLMLIFKEKCHLLRWMIWYLLHYEEEGITLLMKNIIRNTTMTTPSRPFHEIFHNQIAKKLPYVLDNYTNSTYVDLIWCWVLGVELVFHLASKE